MSFTWWDCNTVFTARLWMSSSRHTKSRHNCQQGGRERTRNTLPAAARSAFHRYRVIYRCCCTQKADALIGMTGPSQMLTEPCLSTRLGPADPLGTSSFSGSCNSGAQNSLHSSCLRETCPSITRDDQVSCPWADTLQVACQVLLSLVTGKESPFGCLHMLQVSLPCPRTCP